MEIIFVELKKIVFNIKALHRVSHHYTNSVTQNSSDKTVFKLSILVTF